MKRLKFLLLTVVCVAVLFCVATVTASAEIVDSGLCGDNVTYALDSDGTLTISGTGHMSNYLFTNYVPWSLFKDDIKNVIIEEGVISIGDYAFDSCSFITSVTIPESITSIGWLAFRGCNSLTNITIPDNVTSIEYAAFASCKSLACVTIPDSVTVIRESVFMGCSSLTSIIIPDSVTSIGDEAFSGCTSLTNIKIPDSVTNIAYAAFEGCTALTSITIPNSVTNIAYATFRNCTSLINITIPDSVTDIREEAFSGCTSLTSITIPDSVNHIGYSAFSCCSSLQSVTIPDSVTSIESSTFYYCSSLQSVTIGNSVTSIGSYAFDECTSLQNVTMPDSLTIIGSYAFSSCISLQSVTIGDSVTSIGGAAFHGCSNLQSISIPDSVTSILNWAFEDCFSLHRIYIEDLEKWFAIDFANPHSNPLCYTADLYLNGEKVTDVVFPVGTIEIGSQLSSCTSLVSVSIPNSVTSIGNSAFYGCTNLQSVTIGDSVTSIEAWGFNNCSSLRCVIFNGTSDQWNNILIENYNSDLNDARRYCLGDGIYSTDGKAIYNKNGTMLIYHYDNDSIYIVPEGVKSIEQDSFNNSTNLSCIVFAEGVKNIGSYVFSYTDESWNLHCIYLPSSIISIDQYAFSFCDISDIYFGGSKEQYEKIYLGGNNYSYNEAAVHYNTRLVEKDGVIYTKDMKTLVACSTKKSGTFEIPTSVTKISAYAFRDCENLSEIIIPDTVTSIGEGAFRNCDSIKSIKLPFMIFDISDYLFYDCDSLEEIAIHGNITSIGNGAFYSCDKFKTFVVGNGLVSIGDESFRGCVSIEALNLPETLKSIGNYAFSGCTKLSEIYFPSSVTIIGSYALSENLALTYVSLPDSVNSLGDGVFYNCANLEKICLPEGTLASIPANAFNGCQKLTSIFIPENITSFGDSAFYGCNNLLDIYYGATEAEWDKISIVSSNSVIWAATVHFEHSHTNSKWQTIFEPEAHTTGLKSSICDVCSYERREAIPVIHTEVSEDTVASTCSAIGYTAGVYCNECQKYISGHEEITIDADAHKWDNGTITTTATCKVSGVKTYTCQHDATHKKTENLGVNASNHINTKNTEAVASTCSTVGYTAGVWCNDCEKYISGHEEIAIDADAHMWDNGTITTIATCKVNGVKTYICQHDATHKKTENLGVNTSNHVNTKNTEAVASTCSTVGYTAGVWCNDCEKYISGHEEIAIDAEAHKWDNGTITTIATCKVSGVKTYICQHDASHKKTESLGVNVSNHVNTKNVAEVKATCTTKGYTAGVYCNDCEKYISGHTEIGIDVNAHKWDNGTITTVATCKVSGVKTYTCQHNASHKKTEKLGINASNHVNTKNVAEVKATCTTKGYTAGVYCNDCQKYISGHAEIAINPANHVNTKNVPETPATFEKVGYTAGVYCNDCKKYISGHVEIPKLVPEFTDSKDAKESGNDIISNNGLTVAQLLSQAGKGAVIKTADGKSVENAVLIGTGMVLTMADGSKKEIVVYGDVDGDGKISAADARLALRTSVGLEKYSEDSCYYKAANVESKDKLSAADARLILRASVGLEDPKSWMK